MAAVLLAVVALAVSAPVERVPCASVDGVRGTRTRGRFDSHPFTARIAGGSTGFCERTERRSAGAWIALSTHRVRRIALPLVIFDRAVKAAVIAIASVVITLSAAPALAAEPTPDGQATLMNRWRGPSTVEGRPPEVLVAWRVTVAAGGRSGTVRVRARGEEATALGHPVTLPAEPGTYTFPAPHLRWDYRTSAIGIEQETGGHAIIERRDLFTIDVSRAGAPEQRVEDARLAIEPVFERDVDSDYRGDLTEDNTDLGLTAAVATREDGRLRIAVTLTNAGPLPADLPAVAPTFPAGSRAGWETSCAFRFGVLSCGLPDSLPVGESRTYGLIADARAAGPIVLSALSEGVDPNPDNNTATVTIPAPSFTVTTEARHALRRGIALRLASPVEGRARVVLRFRIRGRTVKLARNVRLLSHVSRGLTVRPQGAKLRSLRRALERGPVRATITVTGAGRQASPPHRITVTNASR